MHARESDAEDMGPAVSLEDVLTVIVVILVLRVVLFVPMINMDRARLDRAEKETYWQGAHAWIVANKQASPLSAQYEDAFEIAGKSLVISESPDEKVRYLESADDNDNVLVIRHDIDKESYYSMYIQKFSTVPSYRHGRIKWSPQEKKWFTLDNKIEYNQTPGAVEMQQRYRKWAEKRALPE